MKRSLNMFVVAYAAIAALALGSTQAHAGLLLEPYVGYYTGEYKKTDTDDLNGMAFGGRVGYQSILGLMLGADYMTGSWTLKTSSTSLDYEPTMLGVFVGWDFPVLLRVYGSYFLSQSASVEGFTQKLEEGNTMRLGVGFTVLPLVSINLEYLSSTYEKLGSTGTLTPEVKNTMYGLSVSLPLDL